MRYVNDRERTETVVFGSTWLSPGGSTATLTMLWRNSWSITAETQESGRQFVKYQLFLKLFCSFSRYFARIMFFSNNLMFVRLCLFLTQECKDNFEVWSNCKIKTWNLDEIWGAKRNGIFHICKYQHITNDVVNIFSRTPLVQTRHVTEYVPSIFPNF